MQVVGIKKKREAGKEMVAAQKEVNEIQTASQKNQDKANLRQQAREARIARARVAQASENLGTSGGSREIAALSSVSQQQSQSAARVGTQQKTAAGISIQNQRIADAQGKINQAQSIQELGNLIQNTSESFAGMFGGGTGG